MFTTDKTFGLVPKEKWESTTEISNKLGISKTATAQSLYLLRNEGSIESRAIEGNYNGEYEHRKIKTKRPVKRSYIRKKPLLSNKKLLPKADALDMLIVAAAELEKEVRELRAFKEKVTAALPGGK